MRVHHTSVYTPVGRGRAIGGGVDVSQFDTPIVLKMTNQNTNLGLH